MKRIRTAIQPRSRPPSATRMSRSPFVWMTILAATLAFSISHAQQGVPNPDGAELLTEAAERWSGASGANPDGAAMALIGPYDAGPDGSNPDGATVIINPVFPVLPVIVVAPVAPSNLTATAAGADRVDLSWQDNAANEDGFEIDRAPLLGRYMGDWIRIATVGENETAYQDIGLRPGGYFYRVRAFNQAGFSPYSNVATVTVLDSGPNLSGELTGVVPGRVSVGDEITFTGRVFNDGDRATTRGFWVEFWVVDPATGWRSFLCDSIPVSQGLAAGEVTDLSTYPPRAVYSDIPPGTYGIDMIIDPIYEVNETDEFDNRSMWDSLAVVRALSNLTIRDFDFEPQDITTTGGEPLVFAGAILNDGTRRTTGSFRVEVRVGAYPYFDPAGPLLCEPWEITDALDSGGTISLETLAPRNAYSLAPGTYAVGIVVDPQNGIPELDETDNTTWRPRKPLYVGPRSTRVRDWPLYR